MVRVAVIGAGYWGSNLIRVFEELGVLEVVYDINPDLCTCPTLEEALERATAVAIATPTPTHFHLAKQALLASKHVFVEKPFTLIVEEAEELVELAEARQLTLMVGHMLYYHPAVVKLKKLVDTGKLGEIQYIYSHRLSMGKSPAENDILWDLASHDVSTILMLLGEMPESVFATKDPTTDISLAVMEFSKARTHIFVSWTNPFKERKLVVIGDKKMAVFDDMSQEKLFLYSHGEIEYIPTHSGEPLKEECQHFLTCLVDGVTPKTDGREGVRVLQVLEALKEALDD